MVDTGSQDARRGVSGVREGKHSFECQEAAIALRLEEAGTSTGIRMYTHAIDVQSEQDGGNHARSTLGRTYPFRIR